MSMAYIHYQYLWPRVIPAKLVPYLIRERESRRQGAWELDARLRGHDVLLAIVGESHGDGKRYACQAGAFDIMGISMLGCLHLAFDALLGSCSLSL